MAEELTTFKEVLERHPKIPQENLFKIVLVCKNCNHKDFLVKFIKEKERKNIDWGGYNPYDKPNPYKPYKPKPEPYYKWVKKTSGKIMFVKFINKDREYEDLFYCPKCGSSLVALSSEFAKENIAEVL